MARLLFKTTLVLGISASLIEAALVISCAIQDTRITNVVLAAGILALLASAPNIVWTGLAWMVASFNESIPAVAEFIIGLIITTMGVAMTYWLTWANPNAFWTAMVFSCAFGRGVLLVIVLGFISIIVGLRRAEHSK
jgi:hypothetical protein